MRVHYSLAVNNPAVYAPLPEPTPEEVRRALWAALRHELLMALLFATSCASFFTALAWVVRA